MEISVDAATNGHFGGWQKAAKSEILGKNVTFVIVIDAEQV